MEQQQRVEEPISTQTKRQWEVRQKVLQLPQWLAQLSIQQPKISQIDYSLEKNTNEKNTFVGCKNNMTKKTQKKLTAFTRGASRARRLVSLPADELSKSNQPTAW